MKFAPGGPCRQVSWCWVAAVSGRALLPGIRPLIRRSFKAGEISPPANRQVSEDPDGLVSASRSKPLAVQANSFRQVSPLRPDAIAYFHAATASGA